MSAANAIAATASAVATVPSSPGEPRTVRSHELATAWLLLLVDRGATHGYELRRELDAHRLDLHPSVLYRTLRRLERDGYTESRWMNSIAGPRRRCYRLTLTGRRKLNEIAALITATRDVHETFLRIHERGLHQQPESITPDDSATPHWYPGKHAAWFRGELATGSLAVGDQRPRDSVTGTVPVDLHAPTSTPPGRATRSQI